jgi:cytochrome c-type biogenesis protein CcmH
MTVFWAVAAMFLLGALLLLLPPLWRTRPAAELAGSAANTAANIAVYRDQLREAERDLAADLITPDRYEQARSEIRRRVLEDTEPGHAAGRSGASPLTAFVLAVLMPLACISTYLALGTPEAVAPWSPPAATAGTPAAGDGRHSLTPEQIQARVAALAERLRAQPEDAEGWLTLARSYTALGRYRDAVTAMRKTAELRPGNPGVLADLADLTGMAQGKRLAGEPARLIQQALDLDPRHPKSLALAGSAAFEARDYAAARGFWERLLAVLPEGSDIARSIRGSLAEATQLENVGTAPAATAATDTAVSGEVIIAAELAARVQPGDTLFVFARAAQGPRMPLAIQRQRAGPGPFSFKLDDSMAMSPAMKLSGFNPVVVGARISRSGQAMPQSGDLVGQSAPVAPGTKALRIVIDGVQP